MKSDTTEMVLLGAAAAVIALVVAFSMMDDKMDDKRSKKRSLKEVVEEAENEVEGAVEELKDAVDEAEPLLKKVQTLAAKVEAKVPPGSKTARVVNTVKGGFNRVSAGVSAAASLLPDEVKDDAKAKVTEVVTNKAKQVGGWAFGKLKEAAQSSYETNIKGKFPWNTKVAETPLPPGVRGGSREVRL